jgi:ribosomal protein S18 acetylase RimI-like enzyme
LVDSVSLRPEIVDDEPFLYRVYASTRIEELAATGWSEAVKDSFLRMQYAAQRSAYSASHRRASFDVVLVEGEAAGRLYVDRGPDAIQVIDIALLPKHRGLGVGTQLFRALLAEAGAGGRRVTLNVERSNRARGLYERLGFRMVRDGEVYVDLEWIPPDAAS